MQGDPVSVTLNLQSWLPLFGVIVALIAPTVATVVGARMANANALRAKASKKLDVIHTLVNSRLTAALEKIDRLETRLFQTEGVEPTGEDPSPPPSPGDTSAGIYPPGPSL